MIYEYRASRWFIKQFLSVIIRAMMIMQFAGVDPLQAGNVVQLVLVLGLTVGWISTYIFRVSNKEMTYAQQLRDYEVQVMQVYISTFFSVQLFWFIFQIGFLLVACSYFYFLIVLK